MSMHETQAAEATLRYAHTLKVGQLNPMIVADHDIFDMALAIDQHTDLSACFVRQLSQLAGELLGHNVVWWYAARVQLLNAT